MIKDTLKMYDELLAGGCTESQARVQATQLGEASLAMNDFGNKISSLEIRIDSIEKIMLWGFCGLGAMMTAGFAIIGSLL